MENTRTEMTRTFSNSMSEPKVQPDEDFIKCFLNRYAEYSTQAKTDFVSFGLDLTCSDLRSLNVLKTLLMYFLPPSKEVAGR